MSYHGRVGSRRTLGRRGVAEMDGTPATPFAQGLPYFPRHRKHAFFISSSKHGQAISFPDVLYMKRVYRDKKASVDWLAARNEERFSSRC